MTITDIPYLKNKIELSKQMQTTMNNMQIEMIYTGSVRIALLPYMLEILKELNGFKLHFYGPNNRIVPNLDFIVKHGVVSHDTALSAQVNADILISMGVKGTVFIAAKIFEYISTGKPIIHFFSDDFDPNTPYYKEYRNALCINVNDNIRQNAERIKDFIEKPAIQINYEDVKRIFYKCEPEYTFNVIHDNLDIQRECRIKKILLIVDAYGTTMSANGACIKEVAKVFLANEYEVHIMGIKHFREPQEEIVDGFFIHRVSGNFYTKIALYAKLHVNGWKGKLAFLLQKFLGIRTLLLLPFYPMRQPFSCLRYRNVAKKLQNRFGFDLVISCFSPMESLFAGECLKKKFGIRFCTYFVDTLTDHLPKHHFFTKSFLDAMAHRYERKFFESSDLILNLQCHEQNFLDEKYNSWRHKLKIVDIPHLKNRIIENQNLPYIS